MVVDGSFEPLPCLQEVITTMQLDVQGNSAMSTRSQVIKTMRLDTHGDGPSDYLRSRLLPRPILFRRGGCGNKVGGMSFSFLGVSPELSIDATFNNTARSRCTACLLGWHPRKWRPEKAEWHLSVEHCAPTRAPSFRDIGVFQELERLGLDTFRLSTLEAFCDTGIFSRARACAWATLRPLLPQFDIFLL